MGNFQGHYICMCVCLGTDHYCRKLVNSSSSSHPLFYAVSYAIWPDGVWDDLFRWDKQKMNVAWQQLLIDSLLVGLKRLSSSIFYFLTNQIRWNKQVAFHFHWTNQKLAPSPLPNHLPSKLTPLRNMLCVCVTIPVIISFALSISLTQKIIVGGRGEWLGDATK